MVLVDAQNSSDAEVSLDDQCTPEAEFILSALEAGGFKKELRAVPRRRFRVRAALRLFSDTPGAAPWVLYTRDVSAKGLGFITQSRLPLGYGGTIEIPTPGGRRVIVDCTLLRCRESVSGWFEGSLYFNREQWLFDAKKK